MATRELPQGAAEDAVGMPVPMGTGARLRSAREAAGLSLDHVAQQLKLSPRQVKALEDESFGDLPGRTFSRGFVRNYARLLNLDAQDLLAHLPDAAHAPALESPALHATGARMAELPSAATSKAGFGRWLIPLLLVGCVVAAAAYEWYRGGMVGGNESARGPSEGAERKASMLAPTRSATVLPNPLTSAAQAAAEAPSAETPDNAAPAAQPLAAALGDAPLVLSFQGPSWTEIRDAHGELLVSRLVAADSVEPVRGAPPFEIVLGNALAVTITYYGKPVDLMPYTRKNVARLTLR